nr:hypothetical protein [Tanacetum cinerariifolium]
MTTLVDKAILSGVDNRPPMLEKYMYDSWKSRMKLYMMNRQHGRMILESVGNGPLICPTIEENGVSRPRKYSELTHAEAIQADCDVKATNIILEGLPPETCVIFELSLISSSTIDLLVILVVEYCLLSISRFLRGTVPKRRCDQQEFGLGLKVDKAQ